MSYLFAFLYRSSATRSYLAVATIIIFSGALSQTALSMSTSKGKIVTVNNQSPSDAGLIHWEIDNADHPTFTRIHSGESTTILLGDKDIFLDIVPTDGHRPVGVLEGNIPSRNVAVVIDIGVGSVLPPSLQKPLVAAPGSSSLLIKANKRGADFFRGEAPERLTEWRDKYVQLKEDGVFDLVERVQTQEVTTTPLSLLIDPGTAPKEKIAGFLDALSELYEMMGGSGITYTLGDVRTFVEDREPVA